MKQLTISQKHSIVLLIFNSLMINFVLLYLGHSSFHYLVFFLNLGPILLFSFFLFYLIPNIAAVVLLNNCLFGVAALVNYMKIKLRQDPFHPVDLSLFFESLIIFKEKKALLIFFGSLALLLLALLLILCFRCFCTPKISIRTRMCGLVVVIGIGFLGKGVYADETLKKSLDVTGNPYFLVDVYRSHGFVYSFFHDWSRNYIPRPLSYDKKEFTPFDLGSSDAFRLPPIIVAIMGEAFTDISDNPHFDFSAYRDPLYHYQRIKKEGIHGKMLVPNIGGGTADTEFDFLTGIATDHYKGMPYSYRMINRNTYSFAHYVKQFNYQTVALHPGQSWFYNRQNAYPYLGFDKFIHEQQFNPKDKKAGYMSEKATFDAIISEIDQSVKQNEPLFLFAVTIQNHGLYKDKYNSTKNFDTDIALEPGFVSELSNYFTGVIDADIELNRLVDYLKGLEEEALLVYFGDHMPGFSYQLYQDFPFQEGKDELLYKYEVPYMLWSNQKKLQATPPPYISSNFLPLLIFKAYEQPLDNSFYKELQNVYQQYPVVKKHFLINANGEIMENTDLSAIERYQRLEHFLLFDQEP